MIPELSKASRHSSLTQNVTLPSTLAFALVLIAILTLTLAVALILTTLLPSLSSEPLTASNQNPYLLKAFQTQMKTPLIHIFFCSAGVQLYP